MLKRFFSSLTFQLFPWDITSARHEILSEMRLGKKKKILNENFASKIFRKHREALMEEQYDMNYVISEILTRVGIKIF